MTSLREIGRPWWALCQASVPVVAALLLPVASPALDFNRTVGKTTAGSLSYPSGGAEFVSELGEQINAAGIFRDGAGYYYILHETSMTHVTKVRVDPATGELTDIGVIEFPEPEQFVSSAAINRDTGYLYVWTEGATGDSMAKVRVGVGDAPPVRVTAYVTPEGEANAMAIDEANNEGYVAHNNGWLVKYNLGTGDATPTVVGKTQLYVSGRTYSCIALNTTTRHFYVGEVHNGARFYKGTMGAAGAAPAKTGDVFIGLGHQQIKLDEANNWGYLVHSGVANNEAIISRVNLGTGSANPSLMATLNTGYDNNRVTALELDLANGHGFLTFKDYSTGVKGLLKLALNSGTTAPSILNATSFPQVGDARYMSADYDIAKRRLMTGSVDAPAILQTFNLGDPATHVPTEEESLTMAAVPPAGLAFLVDETRRLGYLIDSGIEPTIAKIDVGTSTTVARFISKATIGTNPEQSRSAVYDPVNNEIVMTVGSNSAGWFIETWTPGVGNAAPSRLQRVALGLGNDSGRILFIDPPNRHLWLTTRESPTRLFKVTLGAPGTAPVLGASLTMDSGDNNPTRGWIDLATNTGYVVAVPNSTADRIVKLDLGTGADAPTRVGAVTLNTDENGFGQIVVDSDAGLAYLAEPGSSTSRVIKINMGGPGQPPTRVGAVSFTGGNGSASMLVRDPVTGMLYTATTGSNATRASLRPIVPGAPTEAPVAGGSLNFPVGGFGAYRGWFDPTCDQLLVATSFKGNVFKIDVRPEPGMRFAYHVNGLPARFSEMKFYSHTNGGNLRFAIYRRENGGIGSKIWESPWVPNNSAPGWITVPISAGSPSQVDMLTPAAGDGSYGVYLGWMTDSPNRIGGLFNGEASHFIPGAATEFPAAINQTHNNEGWGGWAQHVVYATTPHVGSQTVVDADLSNSPQTGFTNQREVTLNWTVFYTAGDGVEVAEDASFTTKTVYQAVDARLFTLAEGPDGLRTLYFRSSNELGYGPTVERSITLDRTPPVIGPFATVYTTDQRPPLAGTYEEVNLTSVVVTINGAQRTATISPGVWTIADNAFATIPAGVYAVTVRATDNAGNVTTTVFPGAMVIDLTAPTVAIGAPSTSLTTAGPVTLPVNYSEPVNMTLNAGHITLLKTGTADADLALGGSGNISRTVTLSNLRGDGTLRISVATGTAADLAGNNVAGGAGPSAAITVDNTAPVVTAVGLLSGVAIAGGPVSGTWAATDANGVTTGTLYTRAEGGTWAAAGPVNTLSGWSWTPPSPGRYEATVVAIDTLGNASVAPAGTATATTPWVEFLWNSGDNAPITLSYAEGANQSATIPVAPGLEVTITFANVLSSGTLTIQRVVGNGAPAGLDAGRLIDEYWVITRGGTLVFDSATVVFEYDAANLGGLSASELNTAFAEGTILRVYSTPDVSHDAGTRTVTVLNVTGFSTWYVGNNDAGMADWRQLDGE